MIIVSNGCQSAGIAAALGGMLPDVSVQPAVPSATDPDALANILAHAHTWVTSMPPDEARRHMEAAGVGLRVVRIPMIYFHGFHPDILHVSAPDGAPLGSPAGEYASAMVVYGWKLGLGHDAIRTFFVENVYEQLGYLTEWNVAVRIAREIFDATDMDFAPWYLSVVRRGTFMLTDNHPALSALVELARQLGRLLGADPARIEFPWEQVIPDGLLATSTVWPVYPELGQRLGVPGGYVWRAPDGALVDLDTFIDGSLARYQRFDPDAVGSPRFSDRPLYESVLGPWSRQKRAS